MFVWKIPAQFPDGLLLRSVTITCALATPALLISLQLFLFVIEAGSWVCAAQCVRSIPVTRHEQSCYEYFLGSLYIFRLRDLEEILCKLRQRKLSLEGELPSSIGR